MLTDKQEPPSSPYTTNCRICLEPVPRLDAAIALPCHHDQFCASCMQQWRQQCYGPFRCPVCNMPVTQLYSMKLLEALPKKPEPTYDAGALSVGGRFLWFYKCLVGLHDDEFDRQFPSYYYFAHLILMLCYTNLVHGVIVEHWNAAVVTMGKADDYMVTTASYPLFVGTLYALLLFLMQVLAVPVIYDLDHVGFSRGRVLGKFIGMNLILSIVVRIIVGRLCQNL